MDFALFLLISFYLSLMVIMGVKKLDKMDIKSFTKSTIKEVSPIIGENKVVTEYTFEGITIDGLKVIYKG